MSAWYAFVRCFLVWRVKEGNAARERTDAPINRARRIKACSPRMQNTKPLDPWYHCHSSNWSWICVCVSVKFVIGIDMKSSIVKYRFDALTWSCMVSDTAKYCRKAFAYLDRCPAAKYIFTEKADKRACLPLPRAFDSRLIMNASRRFGRRLGRGCTS